MAILPRNKGRVGISLVPLRGIRLLIPRGRGYIMYLPSTPPSIEAEPVDIYLETMNKSDQCTCKHTRFSHSDGSGKTHECHFIKQCGCKKFVKDPKRYPRDPKED